MNNADFQKDGPSLQLLGKEFIIVIVVLCSALSFTLGYFVGKNTIDHRPEGLSQQPEPAPVAKNQSAETPPQSEGLPAPESVQQPATAAATEVIQPKPKATMIIVEEKQASYSSKAPQLQAKEKTKGQGPIQQPSKEEAAAKPDKEEEAASKSGPATDGSLYTVQLGAFRSSAEAQACKKKYAQKGLTISVTTSTNDKKEKIYKVRSGEFRDRKKAEVLSVKLNKTGKLKTYIIAINE